MAEEKKTTNVNINAARKNVSGGAGGLWFFGFVGAAVYYVQQSTSFWDGVVGVIKALFWPAFLIYQAFKLLHM